MKDKGLKKAICGLLEGIGRTAVATPAIMLFSFISAENILMIGGYFVVMAWVVAPVLLSLKNG